ncbi:MAG: M20 family metallopeptidase [Caldilineaceae bacterium SB0662_bin_9]|uniref:M20 family metallopeptidase n=1 Tax=Caldilineaceae bacterium SB0662_bin_9 TaxID=2605258 RepID=A0A6B1DUI6_9CHLR|nr:M20 family metallopeptidase [Caldilineaceae bacterium SB0662_bin_9]
MEHSEALHRYFSHAKPAMLESIRTLVEMESPSTDIHRLDRCADHLRSVFAPVVDRAPIIPVRDGGNHLRCELQAKREILPPILVLTHFDTVWPVGTLERMPFRETPNGRAYGPGIFDMKSSLAMMEHIFGAFRELDIDPGRNVVLLATADEEIGSATSRQLIEDEARQVNCVLVLEAPLPGGVLKTARKGSRHIDVHIKGIPAHAGIEIEKGVSAIEEAAHQILAIQAMTDLETGLTVNAGVHQGGTRANVVAPHADIQIDVRAWRDADLRDAENQLRNLRPRLQGTSIDVVSARSRPPLEETATKDVFAKARTIAASLDMELVAGRTGGGSDGNLTGALGVPTLDGLGVPGAGAHADHEHIETDQLVSRTWLLSELILGLAVGD